jgi:hypothetical protein
MDNDFYTWTYLSVKREKPSPIGEGYDLFKYIQVGFFTLVRQSAPVSIFQL